MPTILLSKGYRFFFYINDHTPPHIHIEKNRSTAKFFLKNAELAKSKRFNAKELSEIRNIILENLELLKQNGMSVLQIIKSANAVDIWFDDIKMYLILDDGRELAVPINWFPSLRDATREQRNKWRFIGDGEGIHWEDLDEDILVKGLL